MTAFTPWCGGSPGDGWPPTDRWRCWREIHAGPGWWGYALHVNPDPEGIPCFRVVNRLGETSRAFAFGGADMQRLRLEEEGVIFTPDGRVDLSRYGWDGR